VLGASRAELARVPRISDKIADAIFRSRESESVEEEIERAREAGVRIICQQDADYPPLLWQMYDPPICLYVRGTLRPTDAVAVSIVGTRRNSHYGAEQAVRFGELLAQAGFTIVSGLARGIDGYAHQGALRAGGRTVAVLGNGLASIYPPEHASLADDIAKAGALVSEYPMTISPTPENFPRRNRIIVGLSLGVLVVEAGKRSGALITARLAHEMNREVFAIPGRIDYPDWSAGTNAIIRDGQAKLVTCLDDILDELDAVGRIMGRDLEAENGQKNADSKESSSNAGTMDEPARSVLEAIRKGAELADDICAVTGLPSGTVSTALTSLQLKGLVKRLSGNRFACRKSR